MTKLPCISLYKSRSLSTGTISWDVSLSCFLLWHTSLLPLLISVHEANWMLMKFSVRPCGWPQNLILVTTVCPTVLTEMGTEWLQIHWLAFTQLCEIHSPDRLKKKKVKSNDLSLRTIVLWISIWVNIYLMFFFSDRIFCFKQIVSFY